jgi:hypothetical protein
MLPISGVEAEFASSGNQHAEDLSSGAAANGARERVSERTEIDILGRPRGDISMAPLTIWMSRLMSNPDMTRCSPGSGDQFQRVRCRTVAAG